MLGHLRVVAGHEASYADPIQARAGEAVLLTGRADHWDGYRWLWARATDRREGWVPDALVTSGGAGARLTEDYSAAELACRAGDWLTGLRRLHGWVWCRDGVGQEGWVPERCLAPT
ncbi:MAG: SH3 domain-containing protein [Rhodobacter sp.]|nr:SH3 domain-containing protein [Rhodobacter sp.]